MPESVAYLLPTGELPPRCQSRHLGVLGYANGVTQFSYKTPHTRADVIAPGYWRDAPSTVRPGDWIMVTAADGPLILWVESYVDLADLSMRVLVS